MSRPGQGATARLLAVRELPATPASRPALRAAAADPSREVAREALARLARVGGPEDAPALRELLFSCDVSLAGDVATALAALGDREAVALAVRALGAPGSGARLAAVAALAVFADERSAPALGRALSDPIAAVRRGALDALMRLERSRPSAAECRGLIGDRDPSVRAAAVRAVPSVLEDPAAALSPLARDPAPAVRAELAARLGRLRRADAEALLFDPERGVREVAVRHAGRALAGALAHVLREDNYAELRAHAARQLGRLRARAAAEALLDAIADGDGVVRIAALRALGEIADRSELVAWLDRALGGDLDRRRAALFSLVRLRATEGEARLETLTDDPDPRLALAHAAQELFGEQSQVLSRLRVDPHPGMRHAAARVGQT